MAASLFPFIWMVLNSFRTQTELYSKPLNFPSNFDFGVFPRAWKTAKLNTAIRNSVIITVCAVSITVICSSLAAYPLSRMRFKGKGFLFMVIISGFIFGGQITLIPLFILFRDMQLLGNLASVYLACGAGGIPFSTILFVNGFKDIPTEIDDSTEIDGCSRLRYFFSILTPLSTPIFATVIIFQSMGVWNEFLLSLTFLVKPEVRTIPLEMRNFSTKYLTDYAGEFATLTMMIIPFLVLYIVMQKYFIKGLTAGAVKG
jgi:raffinose/stachyose/melibiose transport system permease protein